MLTSACRQARHRWRVPPATNKNYHLLILTMSLVDSAAFTTTSRTIRTVTLPAEAYVLSLASLPSLYAASSSAPTNAIHLFDKSNLRAVTTLPGHDDAVTSMRVVSNFSGLAREVLVSSGKDALIKVWDERTGSAAVQSEFPLFVLLVVYYAAELKTSRLNSACAFVREESPLAVLRCLSRRVNCRSRHHSRGG